MKRIHLGLIAFFLLEISLAQTPCSSPSISGKLTYDNSQSTLVRPSVVYLRTLLGNNIDSSTADQNGKFRFCSVPNGSYILTTKSSAAWGGVNANDALLAQRHFVQLMTLSGLKYKAGDVNASSYLNSTDAYLIKNRFIQLITTFPNGDWVFEEPQVTVSGTTIQNIDIKALCTGDVDGSYIPQVSFICGDTITDQRDNQKYPTVQIGTQCWFKKNLNIGTMVTTTISLESHSDCSNNGIIEKYCLANNPSNCDIYGGLYDWNEMMQYDTTPGIQGICPTGWHIPTDTEWCTLVTYLDPLTNCNNWQSTIHASNTAGGKLKEAGTVHWKAPNTGANNQSSFTALGSSNRDNLGHLEPIKFSSSFWTSTMFSSTYALLWGLYFTDMVAYHNAYEKVFACSIRCIKY